jgi:hypothetical protein
MAIVPNTEQTTVSPPIEGQHLPVASADGPLPSVRTPLDAARARELLAAAARRGKMPGLLSGPSDDALVRVSDFGSPYESVLEGRLAAGEIRFSLRLKPLMPLVMLAVLVLTVWPGVWLTDSMLRSYFSGYKFQTWMWYLPLTVPTVPWVMWSSLKKSRALARAEAPELIEKVAQAIGGTVEVTR